MRDLDINYYNNMPESHYSEFGPKICITTAPLTWSVKLREEQRLRVF